MEVLMGYPATDARFAEAWQANHGYLVDLAYRMLGEIGSAEDVVQEAFLELSRTADGEIDNERGWLTVVTSRLCLDQLRSARSRRESVVDDVAHSAGASPVGGEPPTDPADRITLADDVRLALLVMLQRLSPAERVAFVLHDVFGMPFSSIAETLGKPAGTCRQLARRARLKIAENPLSLNNIRETEHRQVTERFIAACRTGDLEELLDVLHPDVWGLAEFLTGALTPQRVHGPENVAANLIHYYGSDATLVSHPVTDTPTLLAYIGRRPYALLTLTVHSDQVAKIEALVDPMALELPR